MNKTNKLIIPVYLNQKIVFDLLAIIEDGFSQIRSIQKKESSQDSIGSEVESGIATGNTFGLFSLKLGAKIKGNNSQEDQKTISEEKVHTPTSLFSKLLNHLEEKEILIEITETEDLTKIKPGDFVRIKGTISVNPVIKTFDSFYHMINMISSITAKGTNNNSNKDLKQTAEQIKRFSENMKVSGLIDLLQNNEKGFAAVSQADIRYFENEDVGILQNGEYSVVGKVIKVVTESDEPINLLRNTSLSAASEVLIDQVFSSMQTPEIRQSGIIFPQIKSMITKGLLLIPIAIYS